MTIPRFIAIFAILAVSTLGWMIQSVIMESRSRVAHNKLGKEAREVWGPGFVQPHISLAVDDGPAGSVQISTSQVEVDLQYSPQQLGLLWHRTYDVALQGSYSITNSSASGRNVRVRLILPSQGTSYDNFIFQLGEGDPTQVAPKEGMVETATLIPAGATVILKTGYKARGVDSWAYAFEESTRLKNFSLKMRTNFDEISFPAAGCSPATRIPDNKGWSLEWAYKDVIDVRDIGMDMPKVLNAGPVVARITFFAPLSLLLFFGVVLVVGMMRGINLHPMIYAFLAAGYFSFHLLLAYLCDIMPLYGAFTLATLVSVLLVSGYLHLVVGKTLSAPSFAAQLVYLVLFSYSFFFDGLTGLTLTILGVSTLAMLMFVTARVNWETVLVMPKKDDSKAQTHPPTLPQGAQA